MTNGFILTQFYLLSYRINYFITSRKYYTLQFHSCLGRIRCRECPVCMRTACVWIFMTFPCVKLWWKCACTRVLLMRLVFGVNCIWCVCPVSVHVSVCVCARVCVLCVVVWLYCCGALCMLYYALSIIFTAARHNYCCLCVFVYFACVTG